MESRVIEIFAIIIGIIILYPILNYIFNLLNRKSKIPYSIEDKELKGFGQWRNRSIIFIIVFICLIVFIIAIIMSLL